MPTYLYECYEEKGGCGHQYELTMSLADYNSYQPQCPSCKKKKSVSRFYTADGIYIRLASQTLGSIAEQNTSRMSEDEKAFLRKEHTKYKDEPLTGTLPDGASYFPVDSNGKRIASTEQRTVDPKRVQAPKKPKRKISNVSKKAKS